MNDREFAACEADAHAWACEEAEIKKKRMGKNYMCGYCENHVGQMNYQYEVRGIHHYQASDFCCEAAKKVVIPLTGWERL